MSLIDVNLQGAIAAYAYYVMAHKHLYRRCQTPQQAVEEVANSPETDEEDIVIILPEQDDSYATDVEVMKKKMKTQVIKRIYYRMMLQER